MKIDRVILALESVLNKNILLVDKDHSVYPPIEPLSVNHKLANYLKVYSSNYLSCNHTPINLKLSIKTGSLRIF